MCSRASLRLKGWTRTPNKLGCQNTNPCNEHKATLRLVWPLLSTFSATIALSSCPWSLFEESYVMVFSVFPVNNSLNQLAENWRRCASRELITMSWTSALRPRQLATHKREKDPTAATPDPVWSGNKCQQINWRSIALSTEVTGSFWLVVPFYSIYN